MAQLKQIALACLAVNLFAAISPTLAQTSIQGALPHRKPPKAGPIAPTSGKLGPTARQLRALRDNVPTPDVRPLADGAALEVPNKEPVIPSSRPEPKSAKPATNPETTLGVEKTKDGQAKGEGKTCLDALSRFANFRIVESPKAKDAACKIDNPVQLLGTKGKQPVIFPAKPILDCPLALNFSRFARDTAQPLARFHLKTNLDSIATGPGFTCRRRNNALTGKLSEHAFGNGIDIVAFKLGDGSSHPVRSEADMPPANAKFQTALRTASCGHFTTVLGPGSNAAHATHLHFDLGRSKDRKNPYRICE